MTSRDELVRHLDAFLDAGVPRDYCPNGLQVEGRGAVAKVAFGVSASLAFLREARAWGADACVVHHGLFFGDGEVRVVRSLRARLGVLIGADMSLLGYHLPLDRHPEVGNNAVFARALGATACEPAFALCGVPIGCIATLPAPLAPAALIAQVEAVTGRTPLAVGDGPARIARIGIVTGGAAKFVSEAALCGCDAFLTGEPSEAAVHIAREEAIHLVAAGHHATERFGVQALAEHVAREFQLETRYIEIDNPV